MSDEKFNKEVLRKLDALIRIVGASVTQDKNLTEKILFLGNIGFSPKEISEIANTTSNYANLILSKNRRKMKKAESDNTPQDNIEENKTEVQNG